MIAGFFTYSKRSNSTAIPDGMGTQEEIHLKEESGLLEPYIELQTMHNPTAWNYCYIPDYGRYYFVENWTYYRGIWAAHCSVDVLASFKASIMATTAMVAFSSSDYNLNAIDNRIASTAACDRQVNTAQFAGALGNQQLVPSGYFALTVLDKQYVWATGAATTYFLTYQQMQSFAGELLQPSVWESMVQWFGNPMEGILDCYYLPIDVSQYVDLTTDHPIAVGDITFGTSGKTAQATNMAIKSKHATIEIPWGYTGFRRLPPFSEVSLFVPYCGAKSLPTELVSDVEAILIDYSVDVTSGNVQALAYVKQETLAEFSGNIRVNVPVGKVSRMDSIMQSLGGVATAVGATMVGNPIAAAGGVAQAVSSVVSPATYQICGGMQGSILGAVLGGNVSRWQQFHLICSSRGSTDTPENMRPTVGNALFKVRKLSGLTGYCQTSGASVNAACTQTERERINSMLDSGIYIE